MLIIDALAIMDVYFFITHRRMFGDLSMYFFVVIVTLAVVLVIAFNF